MFALESLVTVHPPEHMSSRIGPPRRGRVLYGRWPRSRNRHAGAARSGSLMSAILVVLMVACAPFRQYRTVYDVCVSPTPDPPTTCNANALQQIRGGNGSSYLMGFIEFDDQGLLWNRKQMRAVQNRLLGMSAESDLLIVVFVHGWKHNTDPTDGNIASFRGVLAGLAAAELRLSQATGVPARPSRQRTLAKAGRLDTRWRGGLWNALATPVSRTAGVHLRLARGGSSRHPRGGARWALYSKEAAARSV